MGVPDPDVFFPERGQSGGGVPAKSRNAGETAPTSCRANTGVTPKVGVPQKNSRSERRLPTAALGAVKTSGAAEAAVDNASSTFAAFAPQEPDVHLILIAKNLDEPEVTGPFYVFQLEGLGPGPVVRSEPRRYLVLVDAEDGSRTMGFPLDR